MKTYTMSNGAMSVIRQDHSLIAFDSSQGSITPENAIEFAEEIIRQSKKVLKKQRPVLIAGRFYFMRRKDKTEWAFGLLNHQDDTHVYFDKALGIGTFQVFWNLWDFYEIQMTPVKGGE